MSDPTMALVESLKRADHKEWGAIKDNMPIFRAHKFFQRKVGETVEYRTTLPGDPDLDPAKGWKMMYEITEKDLEEVCKEANKRFEESGNPIKLLVGHSVQGAPQTEQPPIAGFGVNARMGTFGPKAVPAVMVKSFYRKGFEGAVAELPERSPEFKNSTKVISAVALLKTDPRLPMGMMAYEADDLVFYGVGFMPEEHKEPAHTPAVPAAVATTPASPAAIDANLPAVAPVAPAAPVAAAPVVPAPLTPEEVQYADRIMNHLCQSHPAMKYMCEQYQKYAQGQAAMAAPSPTNSSPANPIGKEKPNDDEEHMQDEEAKKLYEERIVALEVENATLYAERVVENLSRTKKILDPKKVKEKLIKLRVGATDDTACKEFIDEIKMNYANVEKIPVGRNFLPIPSETLDPPASKEDTLDFEGEEGVLLTSEITRYAEANDIDLIKDEDGWDKACDGFREAKKKKQQRQTA